MKHFSERGALNYYQQIKRPNNIISFENHFSKYYESPIFILNTNRGLNIKTEKNQVIGINQFVPNFNKEKERKEGTESYQYQSFRNGNRDIKNEENKIIKIFQRGLGDMKNLNQSERHFNLNQDMNSKLNDYSRNFSEKEILLLKNNLDYKKTKKYIKYISDESDKNSEFELNIISKKKNQRTISNPEINKENKYHGNAYFRRKKYWESKSNSKDKECSKDSFDSLNHFNIDNNDINNNNIYNLKENLKININDTHNNYGLPFSFISRNNIFYKKLPINQVTFITKKIEKIKQLPILNLSFISKKVNNIKKVVINNICFITKIEKKILHIPKLNISFISKSQKIIKYLPQLHVSFISKKVMSVNSKFIQLIPQENFETKLFSKQIIKSKPKIIQKFFHSGTSFSINRKTSKKNLILETTSKIEKANSFSLEKGIIKKPIIPLLYYSKYVKDKTENISIKKIINRKCFITKLYYQSYNSNIINEIILKKPISDICYISKTILPLIKKPINNKYFITKKYTKNPIKIPLKEKRYISKIYFIKAFKKPIQLESQISKIRVLTMNSIKHPITQISYITKINKKPFELKETINKLEKNILSQSQKNISEPIKLIKKNQTNNNNLIIDLSNSKPKKKKTRRGGKAARRRHSNHSNNSKNSSDYSQNSNLNISKSSFKSEISIEMNNNFEIKPKIKSFSEDKLVINDINKKDNNLPIPPKKKNKNEYTLQMEHEVEIQIDENRSSKYFLSQSNLFDNNKIDKFNLFKVNYTEKDNQDEVNVFNKQQKKRLKTQKKNYRSYSINFDNINNSFQTPPKSDILKVDKIIFDGKKIFEKENNDMKTMKYIIPIYNISENDKSSLDIIKYDEDSTKKIILATEKLEDVIKKKIRRNSMNEKKLNKMKLIKNIDNNKENTKKNLSIELNKTSANKLQENKSLLTDEEDKKINNSTGKKFKKILIIPNIPKPKTMSLNFILSIKNYSNSNETYKLPKSVIDHCNKLQNPIYDELYNKSQTDRKINLHYRNKSLNNNKSSKNLNVNIDLSLNNSFNNGNSMAKWARKDLTKENEKAEKFVIDLNNKLNENSIKHDLTSLLNIVTIDNFDDISNKLLNILKDSEKNQNNFIKVILEKAFVENNFIILYAKLCRYLCEIIGGKKQDECYLRKNLIEAVKNTFDKINELDNNKELILEEFYSNKKKFLGLMNLIVELIGVKILSQKIGFYCLNSLHDKYIESNNQNECSFKYIILEMMISFVSKFGKIIFQRNKNDNKNKLKNFLNNKLSQIKDNLTIPVHLKYRIINLFEKEKNNWKDSLYEKSFIPKGKNVEEIKMTLSEIDRENIVRDDMKKWFNYLNENNIIPGNKNTKIFNKYNWKSIDNLIVKEKIELIEIIRCFIEISIDLINKKDDVFKANQYIYCIIDYYSQYLNNEELFLFNNKIISLFLEINNLIIDNKLIFEILGFLMYNLINFKLFYIKDLSKFIDKDKESIINISKVVYFAICNSGKDKKKFLNDFKQNKLYSTNKDIFNEEISQKLNIN